MATDRRRAYTSWYEMRRRCLDPSNSAYGNCGGRGILICIEWDSFEKFYSDMEGRPKNLSLGRIDNELGYSKQNCRWETREQQNQNMRIRRDSGTQITGLNYDNHQNIWRARRRRNGIIYNIYSGKSFEDAKSAIENFNKGLIL